MSNLKRITVISQGGRLVGVHIPADAQGLDANTPLARMVAGPKQKLHETEVELPETLSGPGAVRALHALVRRKLKLRK